MLADYIGQQRVRDNLDVPIAAARQRGEALDHVLLSGPPGLGKTTLAYIIGNEMGVPVKATSGPVSSGPATWRPSSRNSSHGKCSSSMKPPDEPDDRGVPLSRDGGLHRGRDDWVRAGRPVAQAADRALHADWRHDPRGTPDRALRSRFGIVHQLDFYDENDLSEIVTRSARILSVEIALEAAREIARRSRGTPRIANRLLRRVRDFAQVRADGVITPAVCHDALELLEVDQHGFDEADRRLLRTIIDKLGGPGGPQQHCRGDRRRKGPIEDV